MRHVKKFENYVTVCFKDVLDCVQDLIARKLPDYNTNNIMNSLDRNEYVKGLLYDRYVEFPSAGIEIKTNSDRFKYIDFDPDNPLIVKGKVKSCQMRAYASAKVKGGTTYIISIIFEEDESRELIREMIAGRGEKNIDMNLEEISHNINYEKEIKVENKALSEYWVDILRKTKIFKKTSKFGL